jgi:hypothetical protein
VPDDLDHAQGGDILKQAAEIVLGVGRRHFLHLANLAKISTGSNVSTCVAVQRNGSGNQAKHGWRRP